MTTLNRQLIGLHLDKALSAYGPARPTIKGLSLDEAELRTIDAYWRASLYLCLGMLYLKDNPLLRLPPNLEHTKPRLRDHWCSERIYCGRSLSFFRSGTQTGSPLCGTTNNKIGWRQATSAPAQCFTYVQFNRLIKKYDFDANYVSGPGHGKPAVLSAAYLESTNSEVYPESEDVRGMQRFFNQFSFPGGIGSHAIPETLGSIHEGDELGYSLSHAYGAVFDNSDLIALAVVGHGGSGTGPLATSWHSNKFLTTITDRAVLPVLHLDGYKINNPTILTRISHDELTAIFTGYGYTPYFVEGGDVDSMQQAMAATLEHCVLEIRKIQEEARRTGRAFRPRWPVVILRSPKGWTAPREVHGHNLDGFWRAHQVRGAEQHQYATGIGHPQPDRPFQPCRRCDRSGSPHGRGRARVCEVLLNQRERLRAKHAHEFGVDPPDITNWQWPF